MNYRLSAPLVVSVAALLALGGCVASEPAGDGGVTVAAAFYPLEYAVEGVAGDSVDVAQLTTPGMDAHDIELTPRQVAAVVESDLVVYLSGFQPAVDEAITLADPDKVLDVAQFADLSDFGQEDHSEDEASDHEHGELDPHFWLDPLRLAAVTDAIAERLADIKPELTSSFTDGAQAIRTELTDLDEDFTQGLGTCARRELFTSHAAFGYLADRYDLEQVSVVGISPNVEPSGARIAEVQELARDYDVTTIFFETASSDAVARSIAADLGLKTAVLDPVATLSDQSAGEDYPAIMRSNLTALQEANDCG